MKSLLSKTKSPKIWVPVTFLWGFCEGTFFFIIPDIFISLVALTSLRRGFYAVLVTLLGSLVGAILMYSIAESVEIDQFLLNVPLISPLQIDTAIGHLREYESFGVTFGPISGIPHKIYSLYASVLGLSLPLFLFYSAVSRFLRFIVVVLGTTLVAHLFQKYKPVSEKVLLCFYACFWSLVYVIYFFVSL